MKFVSLDIERLIHSLKTAVACLIGFFFTKFVGFEADQWIVVTIIVLMCAQIYVGSVIRRAYLRFLGTLAGCLFAIMFLETTGITDLSIIIAICLSSFIFSYIATSNENMMYAGTLGAVTTTIIVLGKTPSVHFAAHRFLEISIGILIATLVSQFFLPIHARTHLRRTQIKTLGLLCEYYTACISTHKSDAQKSKYEELDANIVNTLTKQRQLVKDVVGEPLGRFFNRKSFMQSLQAEKEMLRAIDFMHHALIKITDTSLLHGKAAFSYFNEKIITAINTLMEVMGSPEATNTHVHLPSLDILRKEIFTHAAHMDANQQLYIDGFLYSTESLLISLKKLATLHKVSITIDPA